MSNESSSFCILPWIHLNVMPDSSVIPCCISPYNDHYGNGREQSAIEIWNSEKFKKIRLQMLAGETIPGCIRCTSLEKVGFKSMRQEMNHNFQSYLELTKSTNADGSLENIHLKYIDIRFSNLCNFKCRGCGPTLSSAWFEDYHLMNNSPGLEKKVNSIAVDSPFFWEELKKIIPGADIIYFGGGEPLITKEHYEILSYLNQHKLFDIELRYTTNLSQLNYGNYDLSEIWSAFKKVTLGISIDDIGERAEYFRHGTKWSQIEKNFDLLLLKYPLIERVVNCTVNIMNVFYLPQIYEYLINKEYIGPSNFHINLLLDPDELRIDVLPLDLKKLITIRLKKFKFKLSSQRLINYPLMKDIDNILQFMNENDNSKLLSEFQNKTIMLDHIRKENFLKTFPELHGLMST